MDQQEQDSLNKEDFLAFCEIAYRLSALPDFGVWCLTIPEAAELLVLDMWYSGELPGIEEPEDWGGNEGDPRLKELLTPATKDFESRLIAAVEKGALESVRKQRDFDECLVSDQTVIDYSQLCLWLEERGYTAGDAFDDWSNDQTTLHDLLAQEAAYLRFELKRGARLIRRLEIERGIFQFLRGGEPLTAEDAIAAYKAMVLENQRLKEQLRHREEQPSFPVGRPFSKKERDTRHVIIEALCCELGINTQKRGASQRIREITERSPVAVDDGTIKKILDEIPESLQRRKKK
ncbi:hypothetical protein [Marichromatium bheemlicum]|uniref:Uncharacterized protein n=1 Tax=Marichromatium bheemlicum TaxID=365339 RepID=A0ABX1I979_9GAMM|nr:hypothetical protein [Marichromatium bheemlicum]NKN34104.1 hypothetical protein [Marichromatium bheemlicum]